jgi:hypothetical protein
MTIVTLASRNSGLLLGTPADDLVQGCAAKPNIVNGRNGVIRLRQGDDTIRFRSFRNPGVVQLGAGRDWLTGLGTLLNGRVSREGDGLGGIGMGKGADRIGSLSARMRIDSVGWLDLGSGRDQIWATDLAMAWAPVDLGPGDDLLDAAGRISIAFASGIWGGAGNDRIIAVGGLVLDPDAGIDLGSGDDLLDAAAGFHGLWGQGSVRLGSGDDVFRGFLTPWSEFPDAVQSPWGTLQGGKGWDVQALPQGRYAVVREAAHLYPSLYSLTQLDSGLTMQISGINALQGLSGGGGAIREGLFVVSAAGLGAFT